MTPAYANEKLVIDLKHVLEDIEELREFAINRWYGCKSRRWDECRAIYTLLNVTEVGQIAKKELEKDRERAAQGAQQQEGTSK